MIELIEKTSYEAREQEIETALKKDLSDLYATYQLPKLQEYIALQVELAFKAGMLHFNALDHTLKRAESAMSLHTIEWHKAVDLEGTMSIGDFVTLPSLYLQAKGFKPCASTE